MTRIGEVIVLVAAGLFGGFAFLAYSDYAIVRADWCSPSTVDCVREWIGALAGWAATVAGIATVIYLARQIAEMKRQTAFMIGDADPTVELRAHTANEVQDVEVSVTNWNRRALTLDRVDILTNLGKVERPTFGLPLPLKPHQRIFVKDFNTIFLPGWKNRSGEGPPEAVFGIGGLDQSLVSLEVVIHATLVGEGHERIKIVGRGEDFWSWHAARHSED